MSTPSIISAIQKLRVLLSRDEKLTWLGIVLFALTTSFVEVLTASLIVLFVQVLNQPNEGKKYFSMVGLQHISLGNTVLYMAVLVGIIYLIKNIVAAVEIFYQNFSIQKMNYHFKNKLLQRYATADYEFYMTRNSSHGIQLVAGEVERMFSNGVISLASILSEGVVFLCLTGMIIYINPSLAFIIFGVGALIGFLIIRWMLPFFYKWGKNLQTSSLSSGQNLIQFFHAFKEIVLLGKRDAFVQAYQFHSQKKSHAQAIQAACNGLPRIIIEIAFVGLFITTIAFMCLEKDTPMQMVGILGGYLYLGFRLMPGLNRIINQLSNFKAVIPSIESVYYEYTSVMAKESYLNIPNFSFKDAIYIQNLNFCYLNTQNSVLSDISLVIKKNEFIGIVGETGSGKSTLIDIILGLLKPAQGGVMIDNKFPVNAYQWHEKIGYVPQSIYLTDDTIEANIAFGEHSIDLKKLNESIEAAQLRNFVEQLPEGTKTLVGDRGIRLSGGERQRIAIARALYRNPEVLIFDEATSALDNETETRLMETIYGLRKNRTIIMIAHRLTTLQECDQILVIEQGKITKISDYENFKNTKEMINRV